MSTEHGKAIESFAFNLILLVCSGLVECLLGTGSMPRHISLCMAGPRMGLDMKTVVGINPGLMKTVTSIETPALPVPDGLG